MTALCKTTVISLGTSTNLNQILRAIYQGDNPQGIPDQFLTAHIDWLLWVEPTPKSEPKYCQPLFYGKGAESSDELKAVLVDDWQFSEFFWFLPSITLQGLQTEQGIHLKKVEPVKRLEVSEEAKIKRTPYIRQDMHRFNQQTWFKTVTDNSPLIKAGQLSFYEYYCEDTKQIEFILGTGEY